MSTEQVILNLDNVEIKEKYISFQDIEYKLNRVSTKQTATFLYNLKQEKNLNELYIKLIEYICPDILEKTYEMLDEHKEILACVLFKEGFNIDIKDSFRSIQDKKEKEEYVKKKLK